MFVYGKSRTVFFPSDTLIYGISRDGSKNFNIFICEHMILGQLSMGARQTKNAPLLIYMWGQENEFPHVWVIYFRLCVIYVQAGCFVWCAKRASAVYWHLWYWVSTINWIGRKGHLQFIGFLGHYFTPDGFIKKKWKLEIKTKHLFVRSDFDECFDIALDMHYHWQCQTPSFSYW